MKVKITLITLFSMLLGVLFPAAQPTKAKKLTKSNLVLTESNSQTGPAKFALLIGINDYSDSNIKKLNGTINDVELMQGALIDLYGFNAKNNMNTLVSNSPDEKKRPTQKVILENLNLLLENARKYYTTNNPASTEDGAIIVFYYSGHGSHVPDLPNEKAGVDGTNLLQDESDGEDETIVPMDSDVAGTKDIRDDKFNQLFRDLRKYTSNITFIFDSCHSGTVTRGFGEKSLDRPSAGATLQGKGMDKTLDESMDSNGEKYVTISGSLPNQKSQESTLPDQTEIQSKVAFPKLRWNGYLTYFLVQTLRKTPDATYGDVMKKVSAAVQQKNADQSPQVEGDVNRRMFKTSKSRDLRGVLIKDSKTKEVEIEGKKVKETTLTIEAGKIVGALQGGDVGIYRQIGDTEPIAIGEIVEAKDFTSTVKVLEKEVPPDAKIILLTPFFGNHKRVLALDLTPRKNVAEKDDVGLQMIKRLAQKMEKNDFVTTKNVVDPLKEGVQKDWEIALIRSTYGEFTLGNRQPLTKDTGPVPNDADEVYYLSSINGKPLYNFYVQAANPEADTVIQEAFEKFVKVENVKTLGNEVSDLNKGLEMKIVKLKTLKDPPGSLADIAEDGYLENKQMKLGDYFSFEISNKTGKALFPYIYSIGTNGQITLLYEPASDGDKLQNNSTLKTLASEVAARVGPPLGVETFKLIASSQRFDGKVLESSAITKGRKGINPLEELLIQASSNTRNSTKLTFEFSGWATTSLDIEIKEQ